MKNEHKLAIQYNIHDDSNFKEFNEGALIFLLFSATTQLLVGNSTPQISLSFFNRKWQCYPIPPLITAWIVYKTCDTSEWKRGLPTKGCIESKVNVKQSAT